MKMDRKQNTDYGPETMWGTLPASDGKNLKHFSLPCLFFLYYLPELYFGSQMQCQSHADSALKANAILMHLSARDSAVCSRAVAVEHSAVRRETNVAAKHDEAHLCSVHSDRRCVGSWTLPRLANKQECLRAALHSVWCTRPYCTGCVVHASMVHGCTLPRLILHQHDEENRVVQQFNWFAFGFLCKHTNAKDVAGQSIC